MIKIDKPNTSPTILTTKGAERTQNDCDAFDRSPDDYRSGNKRFEFPPIYREAEVTDALKKAQNNKCCYCEKLLDGYDVEHFRPKGAVKQADKKLLDKGEVEHYRPKGAVKQADKRIQYPGYYWLVYAWDNLFLSCRECNSKKGILFPLEDDAMRARSHHYKTENEQPLFINPANEEPSEHIGFRGHRPVPITSRGRETIKGLGLRRDGLEKDRSRYLEILRLYRDLVEKANDSQGPAIRAEIMKVQDFLKAATLPAAEFSSMARDFLEGE